MIEKKIRTALIEKGVENLQEFEYPGCNAKNILTDGIYREFFLSMLKDNKGHSAMIDKVIDELITEISKQAD